jgi:hypothetical protein
MPELEVQVEIEDTEEREDTEKVEEVEKEVGDEESEDEEIDETLVPGNSESESDSNDNDSFKTPPITPSPVKIPVKSKVVRKLKTPSPDPKVRRGTRDRKPTQKYQAQALVPCKTHGVDVELVTAFTNAAFSSIIANGRRK